MPLFHKTFYNTKVKKLFLLYICILTLKTDEMKKLVLLPVFILIYSFSFSSVDLFEIDTELIEKQFEILNIFEELYVSGDESLIDI